MDLDADAKARVRQEGLLANKDPTVVDAEPGANSTTATVRVVSALTGSTICSVEAKSMQELKAGIEQATGVGQLDQCLILESNQLVEGDPIAQVADRMPVEVGLLRKAPIVGAVGRAIDRLDADDLIEITDFIVILGTELADIDMQEGDDMGQVASLLVDRVSLQPTLAEACAAVAATLRNQYGEKFSRDFLLACQAEFENVALELSGIGTAELEQTRERVLAMAMFIGFLFVWQVLPVPAVENAIWDLIGSAGERDRKTQGHRIECICELLVIAGYDLDHTPEGKRLVTQVLSQLSELVAKSDQRSGESVYSDAVKDSVQEAIELRCIEWCWWRL